MTQEATIISILNNGLIEFNRILNDDTAFILEHKTLNKDIQIVLFVITPVKYRMFLYNRLSHEIVKTINYSNIAQTWSVYNSLSLHNAFTDKGLITK